MTDLDDKETILNLRYGTGWDTYRLAVGGWNVKIGDDSVRGDTLESALDAAVAFVPLPKIPRRPMRFPILTVSRAGSKWQVLRGHDFLVGNLRTKQAAQDLAVNIAKRAEDAAAEWESKYLATVTNGTEGVDWRWER